MNATKTIEAIRAILTATPDEATAEPRSKEPTMSRDLEQRLAALALEAKTAGDLVGAAVCLRALGHRMSPLGNIDDFTLTGKEADRVRALAPNKAAARREAEKTLKNGEG